MKNQKGFTLVELSIVLVIIGFLIGGIMIGRSLVQASKLQATIEQVAQFNQAINTFQSKYNFLPGDIPASKAAQLGFFTYNGTLQYANGNGIIETISGGLSNRAYAQGEGLMFWRHLSDAKLVAGAYGSIGDAALATSGPNVDNELPVQAALPDATTPLSAIVPPAKIGRNMYFVVATTYDNTTTNTLRNKNYFFLTGIDGASSGGYIYNYSNGLTQAEAQSIDAKTDDGLPNAGDVQAQYYPGLNATWAAGSVAGNCMMGGGSNQDISATYNTLDSSQGCWMAFAFQ